MNVWSLNRRISTIVLVLLSALLLASCKEKAPSIGYNDGYAPKQPIPFSHKLHAGTYKMQCLYCHTGAESSRHAAVPSLNICMNCHLTVGQGEQIQKIRDAYANKTSVKWVKVHMLPDFVHFNHKPHVRKGVACQECHGKVEEMKVLKQHSDLSMGWCVNCHGELTLLSVFPNFVFTSVSVFITMVSILLVTFQ